MRPKGVLRKLHRNECRFVADIGLRPKRWARSCGMKSRTLLALSEWSLRFRIRPRAQCRLAATGFTYSLVEDAKSEVAEEE